MIIYSSICFSFKKNKYFFSGACGERRGAQSAVPRRESFEHEARHGPSGQCVGGGGKHPPRQVPCEADTAPSSGVPLQL